MKHFYAMIMAGGGGTRLWPMSRTTSPKQLLSLVEQQSMFRASVERLSPLFPPDHVYVVTGTQYAEALMSEAPDVPRENFIIEPYGKDSGPAALLGMTVIQQRDPEATVAILTADHHIADKEGFRNSLSAAYTLTQENYIVTLGISPAFPSTGFGYIQRGEWVGQLEGFDVYHSLGFTEKPDKLRAAQFIQSGAYSWNSGMFIWKAEQALAEFERQQPTMHRVFTALAPYVDTPDFEFALGQAWENIEKISLDFAVMEGAARVVVIHVDIGWSDIGSWSALFDVVDLDTGGNSFKGQMPDHISLKTHNTLVYSDKLVVTVGVDNLVIVNTNDALMVCHRDHTQDVKAVVAELKAHHLEQYL
jgi:mannose-1-phosphate guanylyltransferase